MPDDMRAPSSFIRRGHEMSKKMDETQMIDGVFHNHEWERDSINNQNPVTINLYNEWR